MNIIITILKCILSRAEIILYLQSIVQETITYTQYEEIFQLVNTAEYVRGRLEDQAHLLLDSIVQEERQLNYIKSILIKVINIIINYLNLRGCRLDDDKKLQKQMYTMSIQKILSILTLQSINALNDQQNILKSKRQSINGKTFIPNVQTVVLLDLKRLQQEYQLNSTYSHLNSFTQSHLIQLLQIEFIDQQIIYAWLIRTFRVCQYHIQEGNLKVEIQEERFLMLTDYVTKRFDILYKELQDRNSYIQSQISNFFTNSDNSGRQTTQMKKILNSKQKTMINPLVYYTQERKVRNILIKKINSQTSRKNQFLESASYTQKSGYTQNDASQSPQKLEQRKSFSNHKVSHFTISNFTPSFTKSLSQLKESNLNTRLSNQSLSIKIMKYFDQRKGDTLNTPELQMKRFEIPIQKTYNTSIFKQIIPRSSSNLTPQGSQTYYLNNLDNKISQYYRDQTYKNKPPIQSIYQKSPKKLQDGFLVVKSLNLLKFHLFSHGLQEQK